MQRTSLRTLVLLLELFAAVVALQYLVSIRPGRPSAVWLADDCTTHLPVSAETITRIVSV
jgi:hypothetical protein